MNRSPSFRVYASDFLGSPTVQLMEAAEVGAYWLLLLTAWEQERHGYLPDDQDKLRRWSRLTREQWAQSRELILSRFPVVEDGWRANPRMVLEAEKARVFADKQKANGEKGGRPKKNPNLFPENPLLTKTKPNPSKRRSQKKLAVAVAVTEGKRNSPQIGELCESFRSAWNSNCGPLAKVDGLGDERKRKLRCRMSNGVTVESFTNAVKLCASTPFLRGETTSFRASFDWLLKNETNMKKVLEGQYAGSTPADGTKRCYHPEDFSAND